MIWRAGVVTVFAVVVTGVVHAQATRPAKQYREVQVTGSRPATVWIGDEAPPTGAPASAPASQPVLTGKDEIVKVKCPVTGATALTGIVARYRGNWVYFATPAARQQFLADPLKYADRVQEQWAANPPRRVQVRCPVTGQPPAPDLYVGEGEDAVFFATADAKALYEREPERYQDKVGSAYSFQTGCGLCGQPIDPRVSEVINREAVYFCCSGCAAEGLKDAAAVKKRIDQQKRENMLAILTVHRARKAAEGGANAPAPLPTATEPPAPATQPTTRPAGG